VLPGASGGVTRIVTACLRLHDEGLPTGSDADEDDPFLHEVVPRWASLTGATRRR